MFFHLFFFSVFVFSFFIFLCWLLKFIKIAIVPWLEINRQFQFYSLIYFQTMMQMCKNGINF